MGFGVGLGLVKCGALVGLERVRDTASFLFRGGLAWEEDGTRMNNLHDMKYILDSSILQSMSFSLSFTSLAYQLRTGE